MFRLFGMKRKKAFDRNPLQDRLAGKLVLSVLRIQRNWAAFMNRKVNALPAGIKKFALVAFTACSAMACLRIIYDSFQRPAIMRVQPFVASRQRMLSNEARGSPLIPERLFKRINAFHHYMDSLAGTAAGRRIFDSIQHCRPGLLDSTIALEKLYHEQNKSR